ncbi:lanthionine synthetase LanC family protein [uncultured Cyclobacterium sp.]|jgi:lantibiotic modifying enzyme|uniref:lanthionine synthetase LanC family protein n=1 Tax=uncultured Cyclobacterium sp. TaxID=453820 RepID=UPI0030EEC7A7
MNKVTQLFHTRDELLLGHYTSLENPGLFKGKFGLCLYFFEAFQQCEELKYQHAAEHLLQEGYNFIHQNPMPTSFDNGLAGIAWGINQLIKRGYLEGNADELLMEIDTILFKVISEKTNELEFGLKRGILGYLIYILDRVSVQPKNAPEKVNSEIFTSLAVLLINRIHIMAEENSGNFTEPKEFNLFWDLPNYLYVLGEINRLNIMPNKTRQMIRNISSLLLSLIPQNLGNCLSLLYGMSKVAHEDWSAHTRLLQEKLNSASITSFRLGNKSLYVENGLSGLILLDKQVGLEIDDWKGLFNDEKNVQLAMQHLEKSEYWRATEKNPENEMGFIYGITGIHYALLFLKQIKDPQHE